MQIYRTRLAANSLTADPAQRRAVEKLQILHLRLENYDPSRPKRVGLGRFGWGRERIEQKVVPGLYIYGDVGRGKSMLMDLFFDAAPTSTKRRVHFHAFMQEVHAGIHTERQKGVSDPVKPVADTIADTAMLLCFDEMQVTDITDAMLVGRLFERLFERGVVVVTTSNRPPDDLYKNGLNRHLFLPFIALIKDRLDIHELESPTDHRMDREIGQKVYFTPNNEASHAALDAAWSHHAGEKGAPLSIPVQGRTVDLPLHAHGVARASFADLCARPLGPADYLALARDLRVLILQDIPALSPANNNEAKRFVTLVDSLYEARVLLICSAAAEPEALYTEGVGAFEFHRTVSRLEEMRSATWP